MRARIFWAILALALLFELLALALCLTYITSRVRSDLASRLEAEAHYLTQGIEREGTDYLKGLGPGLSRISLIAPDGTVLYDSQAKDLDRHDTRPEVRAALAQGRGWAERKSASLGEMTSYSARRLADGNVLRVAATGETAIGALKRLLPGILVLSFLAFLLCTWLAAHISCALVAPLNAIDPAEPEKSVGPSEIAPLLARLKAQKAQIAIQIAEMGAQKAAFEAVAENMAEGLILLDAARRVLFANAAAGRLLGVPDLPLGARLLALAREPELAQVLEQADAKAGAFGSAQGAAASASACSGGSGLSLLRLNGRWIEIHASSAATRQNLAGYVLIIQDVTEKEEREALRREFSANVSHELKTPLTSICGRAELLANGMVASEDLAVFAQDIHKEGQRLLGMIGNLLKLSRLESEAMPWPGEEAVSDLALSVRMALSRLEEMASRRGIGLNAELESCKVFCAASLLEELVFNILENAIKYTARGGTVRLCVRAGQAVGTGAFLEVADNGRGIARELQGRVFERFFRLGQSGNGQNGLNGQGGHGLGLSIVKHIADSCHARLELVSAPGQGTSVRVFFPPCLDAGKTKAEGN